MIYAFDESPGAARACYWAGSNDGLVHVSRDGGATWTNVTANIPDLPPLGTVRNIDASKWEAGKAYLTIELPPGGELRALRLQDLGLRRDLDQDHRTASDGSPLSYARNVREDPVRPGLLYLGTENALYVSFDDGDHWQSLQNNLPPTPDVLDRRCRSTSTISSSAPTAGDSGSSTTSRRSSRLTPEVARSEAHLFPPRDAYRFQPITAPDDDVQRPVRGRGPSVRRLHQLLARRRRPRPTCTYGFATPSGNTVRTLDGTRKAGINRVWWDLEGEPSTQIKLRTKPLYADWVEMGEEGWRAAAVGRISILEPPGTYTVVLEAGGRETTQPLRVLKDPHSEGTEEDIRLQTEMLRELRLELNRAAESVNRIEWIRKQLGDVRTYATELGGADAKGVVSAAEELDGTLITLEEKLYQLKLTDTGQDRVRWPTMLAGRIAYLAGAVAVSDFPPTDQHREVHAVLKERLGSYEQELERFLENELPAFNRSLEERSLPRIVTGAGGE